MAADSLTAAETFGVGSTPSNWSIRLVHHLKEQAALARELAQPGHSGRSAHAAALEHVAEMLLNHSKTEGIDNALHLLATHTFTVIGQGRNAPQNSYTPSPLAARVVANVGRTAGTSWDQYVIAILAAELASHKSVDDRREVAISAAQQERADALHARDLMEQRLTVESSARTSAESDLLSVTAERDALARQIAYLQGQLGAVGGDAQNAGEPETDTSAQASAGDDFPSAAALEAALDTPRVRIAPGLLLSRRQGDTFYVARVGQKIHWLPSATNQKTTISDALAMRQRLVNSQKGVK